VQSQKKRVLLLGASGYLGTQLMAVLRQDPELETIGTCCTSSAKKDLVRLDVTEPEPFLNLLEKFRPDEIIWVMMSGQKEQQLIGSGLGALLQWMTEKNRLLFVSTDGIFAQGTGGFTEEDEGMPLLLQHFMNLSKARTKESCTWDRIKKKAIIRFTERWPWCMGCCLILSKKMKFRPRKRAVGAFRWILPWICLGQRKY